MIARVAIAAADARGGERLAVVADHRRAGLQAAVGEQDVAGDHHRLRVGLLDDPVVGRVELVGDHHPLDERMAGHPHIAVADHPYRHFAPEGDLVDLLLHRAGVGVDKDSYGRHRR